MPPATPITAYRRPTTAGPGDFCYISQAEWNNLMTAAQSGDVNAAKKAKNKLQKLDVAARMMGNEGRPAASTCDYCTFRGIPCRVWVNHTVGQCCALCRWRNNSKCNANAVAEDEEEIDKDNDEEGPEVDDDNDEDKVGGGDDDDGMVVDEDDDAEIFDAEMDYISTIGTRGERSPAKEEYVDTEKRHKDGNFSREFSAILAANLEKVDDLQNEVVTRVGALEDQVEGLKDEVSRLRKENMQLLNDNQNMKEDLTILRGKLSDIGA